METKEVNGYKIEFYTKEEWVTSEETIDTRAAKHINIHGDSVDTITEKCAEEIVDSSKQMYKPGYTDPNPQYMDYRYGILIWKTAKESFKTLSELPYYIITKIE